MTNAITDRSGRRQFLRRVGAGVIAASAASLVKTKAAEASFCAPPGMCGPITGCSCNGGGCPPGPTGGCCWTYITETPQCRTYKCCDVYCANGVYGICRYVVCNCC